MNPWDVKKSISADKVKNDSNIEEGQKYSIECSRLIRASLKFPQLMTIVCYANRPFVQFLSDGIEKYPNLLNVMNGTHQWGSQQNLGHLIHR